LRITLLSILSKVVRLKEKAQADTRAFRLKSVFGLIRRIRV